jgi:hypothetical protein
MDGKDSRSLLTRTMSFRPPSLSLSARARALRDRFANSKRSLSDSWKDQSFLDETSSDVHESQESPSETAGSVQSLIKSYPRKNTSTPTSAGAATSAIMASTFVRSSKPEESTSVISVRSVVSEGPVRTTENLPSVTTSTFVSQRSRSLDSLNNVNLNLNNDGTEPMYITNATNTMDFPSPPLLDTPTLSPVHSMPYSFPATSTLDFSTSSIPRPRPIKSASFRQLPHNQNKNTLSQGFSTLSTTSLPPNLPPPPKPPPKRIIETEESNLPTAPLSIQVPSSNYTPSTSSAGSILAASTVPLLLLPPATEACQHARVTQEVPVCVHHSNTWQRDLSGSMDPEEWRDTVSDTPLASTSQRSVPPSHLYLHSSSDHKPKLRHQWSVDESRIAAARDRQGSDVSTSSTAPLRPAEKRRRFFMRKQTNSAPDSFDGPSHSNKSSKEHHSVSFSLGSVLKSRNSDTQAQNIPPPTISEYQFNFFFLSCITRDKQ